MLPLITFLQAGLWRIGGFDGALHPSSNIKFTRDNCLNGLGGLDEIPEDSVDRIFVKDPQIPVGEDVHL